MRKSQAQDGKKETKPPTKKQKTTKTSVSDIQWVGEPVGMGLDRKTLYYSAFSMDGVTYKIGDSVLLRNGDAEPFIARIDDLWQPVGSSRTPMMQGTWYFRRSDTPLAKVSSGDAVADEHEVYLSLDIDNNELTSVLRLCTIPHFDLIEDLPAYLELGTDTFFYRRLFNSKTEEFFDLTTADLDAQVQVGGDLRRSDVMRWQLSVLVAAQLFARDLKRTATTIGRCK
eukprot:TRINITY_DN3295_c0_g2_i2.p1 TRINITY_DN3295_c0_g2~~TRINITY_DN3295_c0_g2_i2.p1  ORF type:complete len:227 (-),score=65.52 TRINITY_DN3295_c0_g2_i2:90-770(-)